MMNEKNLPYNYEDSPAGYDEETDIGQTGFFSFLRAVSFTGKEEGKIKNLSYTTARLMDSGLERLGSPLTDMLDKADEQHAMKNPRYVELREKARIEKEAGSLTRPAMDVFEEIDILREGRENTILRKSVTFMHSAPTLRFTRVIISSIQRVQRGWADSDTWSLDNHIARTLSEQLFHLANNTHGWPQSDEYPEFEDWQNALHVNALKLRNYIHRQDYILTDKDNWIELEQHAVDEAKEAMRWVAENFEALWD